ncbi:MAG: aminotransferase class I/II-fold pyridoxal phosphate-dependent enzyme [bacterium]
MRVAARALEIVPSQIRRITDRAREGSLHLGLGQPDTALHPNVTAAIQNYVASGRAPYTANLGTHEARAAVAFHLGRSVDEVLITHGVEQGLALAFLGMVEPGDEVLIPDPGFPSYANLIRVAGGVPVPYPLGVDWRLDPERVLAAISPKTRVILINSPSNPTGAVHAPGDLYEVLELCTARGIRWISDEIYEDFVYDGVHASPAETHFESGVRLGGLSKSHSMMGWRIGWMVAPSATIAALKGLHQHLVTSACGASQAGLIAALEVHSEHATAMANVFLKRGEVLHAALETHGIPCPRVMGAFYHFIDVRNAAERIGGSIALAEEILEKVDVVTIPGVGFGTGGEGYLRLAYTVDEAVLADAAGRIAQVLHALD